MNDEQSIAPPAPAAASSPSASAAPAPSGDGPPPAAASGEGQPYPSNPGGNPGGGGQPGQPGVPGMGRRNRRRRRRRGKNRPLDANGNPLPMPNQGQQGGRPPMEAQLGPDGQPLPLPPPGAPGQQGFPQGGGAPQGQFQPRPQPQLIAVEGVLDTEVKGPVAFLRSLKRNCASSPEDPEVPRQMVQRMRLRPGQLVVGQALPKGARPQVQRIDSVDGLSPEESVKMPHFSDLTVVDPVQRIDLEHSHNEMVTRVLDLVSPIGFGQRGLIVSPPKAGKTIMLMRIAQAIATNHPKAKLLVLLVDERPEEVTDMRRNVKGEVVASSSDRSTAEHIRLAELTLERSRRLVERGQDVVILLDSITRLARAYNKDIESSGRTLSGGVDSRALERPKKLFGAARKAEEGG
jgi:transcription termination factor Rho